MPPERDRGGKMQLKKLNKKNYEKLKPKRADWINEQSEAKIIIKKKKKRFHWEFVIIKKKL